MSYLFRSRSDATTHQSDATTHQKPVSLEEQQRQIDEVLELLGELRTEMPSFLTAGTVRRFLRAKNWSTEQAVKALKETVKWRRQYRPDLICWEDFAEVESEAQRGYLTDYPDKRGRIVFVVMPSKKSKTSQKEHIKQLVYYLEILSMKSEHAMEDNVVWMCDFQGWTLASTPLWESRQALHIVQNYYPGLIAIAILGNPPRIFESFFKILKPILEPALKERLIFVYSKNSESQKIMADIFDLAKLESAFGGRNTSDLDLVKYAERMRREDQLRGLSKHKDINASSSS